MKQKRRTGICFLLFAFTLMKIKCKDFVCNNVKCYTFLMNEMDNLISSIRNFIVSVCYSKT